MSTRTTVGPFATVSLLWLVVATATTYVLYSVRALPSDVPITLTLGLMGLGAVTYYLCVEFVAYYGGEDGRLT